jgi:cytochrome c oxidase cbb3-type subunit 1
MWNSGITQGLMWRAYNPNGTLAYSFLDTVIAMHPYYIARAFGGLLFLIGTLAGIYNVWRTIQAAPARTPQSDQPILAVAQQAGS